jgi:hypothetical protein
MSTTSSSAIPPTDYVVEILSDDQKRRCVVEHGPDIKGQHECFERNVDGIRTTMSGCGGEAGHRALLGTAVYLGWWQRGKLNPSPQSLRVTKVNPQMARKSKGEKKAEKKAKRELRLYLAKQRAKEIAEKNLQEQKFRPAFLPRFLSRKSPGLDGSPPRGVNKLAASMLSHKRGR